MYTSYLWGAEHFYTSLRIQLGSFFSRLFPELCLQKVKKSLYICSYFFLLCSFHFFFITTSSLMSENYFCNCWHSSFIPLRASRDKAHQLPKVSVLNWQALRHLSPSVWERMDKDRQCTSHHCLELTFQEMLTSFTLLWELLLPAPPQSFHCFMALVLFLV